jgi:hypothetical protein
MFTALCIGCVCVFVLGTAFRFGMLAGLLAKSGVLPDDWRRWVYNAKNPVSKH